MLKCESKPCQDNHSKELHGHCRFDIWAPDRHTSINNLAFSSYAYRQEQIETVINFLVVSVDPDDFDEQCRAYDEAGIDSDTFTQDEMDYIVNEIRKRRNLWL